MPQTRYQRAIVLDKPAVGSSYEDGANSPQDIVVVVHTSRIIDLHRSRDLLNLLNVGTTDPLVDNTVIPCQSITIKPCKSPLVVVTNVDKKTIRVNFNKPEKGESSPGPYTSRSRRKTVPSGASPCSENNHSPVSSAVSCSR